VTISSGLLTRDAAGPKRVYPVRCHQCEDPACLMACLSGAITQREDGLVVIDEDHCVGCRLCTVACPYGAIVVDESRGKAVKCDLCYGKLSPACVDACLVGALTLAEDGTGEGG
jgi:Fe-S-cluster-containing dehydrogenase component